MNTKMGLIAKKLGMGHVYDSEGKRVPVTFFQSPGCVVAAVLTASKHGYDALQLGVGRCKEKNVSKPLKKQVEPLGFVPEEIREFRLDAETCQKFKVGDAVTVGVFEKGQHVDVRAKTIGKGFQGVMKRYGFGGFVATHGSHETFRGTGAVGARTWPSRIYKNRKMPGHMGDKFRTSMNLEVFDVDPKANLLVIKGSVGGSKNQWVEVRLANKKSE